MVSLFEIVKVELELTGWQVFNPLRSCLPKGRTCIVIFLSVIESHCRCSFDDRTRDSLWASAWLLFKRCRLCKRRFWLLLTGSRCCRPSQMMWHWLNFKFLRLLNGFCLNTFIYRVVSQVVQEFIVSESWAFGLILVFIEDCAEAFANVSEMFFNFAI